MPAGLQRASCSGRGFSRLFKISVLAGCTSRVHAVCLHAEHVCTHCLVATIYARVRMQVYIITMLSLGFSIHSRWLGQLGEVFQLR